jgi:adenylate cyclase
MQEEELTFEDFEYVDLTGRSLKTVPVVLHKHAATIIVLNLSRNPMLEIPLDFVQACTTLRDLRLSYMAMKKVPHSVRHCHTLQRLDLSCNRIVDLDDAGLDRLSELTTLKVQNNRMERLPWYFPRLRSLKYLNISNNKFQYLPVVVTELEGLLDLDFSFNMISELPEEIGNLRSLEKLVVVGNQVAKIPEACSQLVNLRVLDCRRNNISDLTTVCMLPKLQTLSADHNALHSLELSLGPAITELDASHNNVTKLILIPGSVGQLSSLVSLDVSHAKLSSLDNSALAQLVSLHSLKLDHNLIRSIPDSIGDLQLLVTLSCSNNQLYALPAALGKLQKLETLDVHNNSIAEIPGTLWNCASLSHVNFTSNLIALWHEPVQICTTMTFALPESPIYSRSRSISPERKSSFTGSLINGHIGKMLPALAYSLERLYLGENKLTDEALPLLMILKELRILNLSFNQIQELPPSFFKNLHNLEELYLSGNHISSIPTEDLHRLTRLQVLFLNGNKLQTLPQELGKVQSLSALDVGSNVLKYNINNWEFDWNWWVGRADLSNSRSRLIGFAGISIKTCVTSTFPEING